VPLEDVPCPNEQNRLPGSRLGEQDARLGQLSETKPRRVPDARVDIPAIAARPELEVNAAVDPAGRNPDARRRGPEIEDTRVASKEANRVEGRIGDRAPRQHGRPLRSSDRACVCSRTFTGPCPCLRSSRYGGVSPRTRLRGLFTRSSLRVNSGARSRRLRLASHGSGGNGRRRGRGVHGRDRSGCARRRGLGTHARIGRAISTELGTRKDPQPQQPEQEHPEDHSPGDFAPARRPRRRDRPTFVPDSDRRNRARCSGRNRRRRGVDGRGTVRVPRRNCRFHVPDRCGVIPKLRSRDLREVRTDKDELRAYRLRELATF
jgi:hypothetical protein